MADKSADKDDSSRTGESRFGSLVRHLHEQLEMERGSLLPLLHALQEELGFIPYEAVADVAEVLNLSRAEVHGVVSFYADFRQAPAGLHTVKICRSEACQARGGRAIEDLAAKRFGVSMDGTRPDGRITLEAVYCLGLCAIGPNGLVDGRPLSRIDAHAIERIAKEIGL
jgi:formate dehydrogenase subunit gamma